MIGYTAGACDGADAICALGDDDTVIAGPGDDIVIARPGVADICRTPQEATGAHPSHSQTRANCEA